jgi:hypothetical protein
LEFDQVGAADLQNAHIQADHGNTVLDIAHDHIVLLDVHPNQLGPHDFIV